ncbi:MAG: biotin transporter BioY [Geminicoccaceae bacterium]|nr:biotin transporter BioY [Geminicoccaceae bacterium]
MGGHKRRRERISVSWASRARSSGNRGSSRARTSSRTRADPLADIREGAPAADRIGYRFRGGRPSAFVPRVRPFGAPSDPSHIVHAVYPHGAIHVPGGTEPIVLHRDAVSGGGSTMPGTVIAAGVDSIGQLRPHPLTRTVSCDTAETLRARAERRKLANAIRAHPATRGCAPPRAGSRSNEDRMTGTLAARLWPVRADNAAIRAIVLIVAGSLLLTLSAKVQVPFWPVPMTMQTFAVLLIGAAFGSTLGALTVAFYLVQGALGLPVFARGGGLAYLAGPTGGYLAGFLLAAWIVGKLAERGLDRRVLTALPVFLLGDLVIFVCGVGWLAWLIGFEKAWAVGVLPFLPAEALKIALAVAVLPFAWRLLGRGGSA